MNLKYLYFGLISYLQYQMNQCKSNSKTYINIERPVVYWYDTKYIKNFTVVCKRLNRQDPRHFIDLDIHTLVTATNNIKIDYYFYQFLTNRYKPSFVEMHFKFCDMIDFDTFIGQTIRNALGGRCCPFPPGAYHFKNMTVGFAPKGFPFTKGRIYCNVSYTEGDVTSDLFRGSIDMDLIVARINKH